MLKPETVDIYIQGFQPEVQERLNEIRSLIKQLAPNAKESISYGMPAYSLNGPLVYFAGYKSHVGLYATPVTHEAFKEELKKYKTGKGSVQFPLNEPLPVSLITRMIEYRKELILNAPKKKKA
jgi:uncharacterized protein YdhG (YjbR/CyaY superfamily)